jgi:hypothetical protein
VYDFVLYRKMADAVVAFIKKNGWDRVVIINYYVDTYEDMSSIYDRLTILLLENNIKLVKTYKIPIFLYQIYDFRQFITTEDTEARFARILTESYLSTRGKHVGIVCM